MIKEGETEKAMSEQYEKEKAQALSELSLPPAMMRLLGIVDNTMAEAEAAAENRFEEPLPEPVEETPKADEIIIDGENEVGSIIAYKGARWLVTVSECSDEPSDDDEHLPAGWHSWLVKVQLGNKALEVVAEQIKTGEARLRGAYLVHFADEQYSSQLKDLAYSEEIGVYDRSKKSQLGR